MSGSGSVATKKHKRHKRIRGVLPFSYFCDFCASLMATGLSLVDALVYADNYLTFFIRLDSRTAAVCIGVALFNTVWPMRMRSWSSRPRNFPLSGKSPV